MFIKIGFEGFQDLQLLVCTRTLKPVGLKGCGRLLIFANPVDSFLHTDHFKVIAGEGADEIIFDELEIPIALPPYLVPNRGCLRSAVEALNELCSSQLCAKIPKLDVG